MSHENVGIVQRLYSDCWGAANLYLAPEVLHPEIVWTAIESAPDSGTRRGHAGSRAYMSDWLNGFDFEAMPIRAVGTTPDVSRSTSSKSWETSPRQGLSACVSTGRRK